MQTVAAIKMRRSVRGFAQKPIAPDLIEKLIDAARLAPTAKNVQPWDFVAITKKETLTYLGSLADNGKFIADCACCIAVFCQDTKYYLEDGCAATVNILIAATDSGLGGCWVAGDKKIYCDQVKQLLGAPQDFKLVSLIALGYPQAETAMLAKKPVKELLHWEKF